MTTEEFLLSDIFKQYLKDFNISIEELSCYTCDIQNECEYAYDLYNTHGDCLQMK